MNYLFRLHANRILREEFVFMDLLKGIKVIDFTAAIAGTLNTMILADLGADVVKVEKPEGEWMRHWGIFMARTLGETDAFLALNRNKRSVQANPKDEEDHRALLDLVDRALRKNR